MLLKCEKLMTQPLSRRRENFLLLTLAGIQFSHIVDFMIMMPMGPMLTYLFNISTAEFGLLVSAYTFAAGASGLLASGFIDRFSRKRLLLTLYSLFALATLACGLAPSYGALLIARVAAGLFGGVLSAMAQTIVGDVIVFERRGRAMALVMTSFSVATVAGVPLGLFLANGWGWHSPFFAIAGLCLLLGLMAAVTMPRLNHHLHHNIGVPVLKMMRDVLSDRNHQKALLMSASMMFAGFTVIPYITIYNQGNGIMQAHEIPYIYLCGGLATLIAARWLGMWTDQWGKRQMFRLMMAISIVPMMMTTLLEPVPLYIALLVSTFYFLTMNGRMIPGMALLTSAAQPQQRGAFMSINGAVQSVALGCATFVGGLLIQTDAQGHVSHFWIAGLVGLLSSVVAYWAAGQVRINSENKPSQSIH